MAGNKTTRDTKQRRLVYNVVTRHMDHPNADEIYMDVHRQDPKVSKATVYRNLNLLSESGDIKHIKVPGADRFDFRTDNHYHVICTLCGKVMDTPLIYNEGEDREVAKETGFQISRHRTVFEGICPECLKKQK